MQIDLRHFEQEFRPAALRKGLMLLQKDLVFAPRRDVQPSHYRMQVDVEELSFFRRADVLSSVKCTCGRRPCLHLAAALLYLQNSELDDWAAKGQRRKRVKAPEGKASPEFEKARAIWQQRIAPLVSSRSAGNMDAGKLTVELLKFWHAKDSFYHLLMVAAGAPAICGLRTFAEIAELKELLAKTGPRLESYIKKGLNKRQLAAWFEATRYAWRLDPGRDEGFARLLLAAWLPRCRSLVQLEEIKIILDAKKQRHTSLKHIDGLLIAKNQLMLRIAALAKLASPKHYDDAESVIAQAELFSWQGKAEKAMSFLEGNAQMIKTKQGHQYAEYVLYAAEFARFHKFRDAEFSFLHEKILHSFYLEVTDVERMQALVPASQRNKSFDRLIDELKVSQTPYSSEKLALLLLHCNRVNELIQLLNRQKCRFVLLHELALKMWPVVPDNFLKMYARNLSAALSETSDQARQERLLLTAKQYLDQLPQQYRSSVTDHLMKYNSLSSLKVIGP